MKVQFAILALLLAVSQNVLAGPRTRQQAMQIAQNKAQSLGVVLSMPTQARRSAAMGVVSDEVAPYFVFNNGSNQGWTIVSGDDRMPEVLGYSDSGTLDLDNLPAPVQDLFSSFELMYNNLGTAETTSTSAVGPRKTGTTNLAIGPLLTTSWSQFSPYYNLTPTSSGSQTATCCVATALAQILYYLYYTQGGQSSTTFNNSISVNGRTASAPRTYDWSSMLPSYLGEYTDAQATAVATLMRDCGYALSVTYGVSESTAYTSAVTSVGPTYFGLASGASYNNCSSATTFFSTIDSELNNYRPCQVVGNGHSFVCDGRSADGNYYHFNFGYGGGDGFYCAGAYNGYDQHNDMAVATGLRLAGSSSSSTAKQGLEVAYNSAIKTAGNRPVGTIPGMYQVSLFNRLKTYLNTAKGVLDGTTTMTDANIKTLINNIGTAEQNLVAKTTPFDSNGYGSSSYTESGTSYRIHSYKQFSGSYAYMGWYYDNDEGTYQGDDPVVSVYTSSKGSKWRFIYDSSSNGYYIGNNTLDQYITEMPGYGQDIKWYVFGDYNNTDNHNSDPRDKVNTCEVVATDYLNDGTFAVTLRPMAEGYKDDQDRYICAWGASGSSSVVASATVTPNYVYGSDPYGDYYSKWILEPLFASTTTSTTPTATFSNSTVEINKGSSATQKVTTNSSGTVTYSSNNLSVATVDPTTGAVTGVGIGTATITAAIGGTTTYNSSGYAPAVATYTVVITSSNQVAPQLSFENSQVNLYFEQVATNRLTTNSDGAVTYSSSDPTIASVAASKDGAVVTAGKTAGTATITANIAATEDFAAASATFTVSVSEDPALRAKLNALIAQAEGMFTADELSAAQTAASQAGKPITGNAVSGYTDGNYILGQGDYYMTTDFGLTQTKTDGHVFYVDFTTSGTTNTCTIRVSDGLYIKAVSNNKSLSTTDASSAAIFTATLSGTTFTFKFTSSNRTYYIRQNGNSFITSTTNSNNAIALYPVTGSYEAASAEQTTLIALAAAITTAQGVTTASQADIDALAAAIAAYLSYKGDVNLDGEVNVADVSALISILRGNTLPGGQGKTDINGYGTTDTEDVRALVNKILKKEE